VDRKKECRLLLLSLSLSAKDQFCSICCICSANMGPGQNLLNSLGEKESVAGGSPPFYCPLLQPDRTWFNPRYVVTGCQNFQLSHFLHSEPPVPTPVPYFWTALECASVLRTLKILMWQ
jgi:hypothetical protein